MKICVFGAGAIGGHLAVRLASNPENQVKVITLEPQLSAIRQNGLELWIGENRYRASPEATDTVQGIDRQDLVLVTLKSYTLPKVVDQLLTLYANGTPMLFLGNGIPWWYALGKTGSISGQAQRQLDPAGLGQKINASHIVGGVIYSPNSIVKPGLIRCGSLNSRFILGTPTVEGKQACSIAQKTFQAAGINTVHSEDIRTEIWKKLLLNASLAIIATLVAGNNHEVIEDPALLALCRKILDELICVAQRHDAKVSAAEIKLDTTSLAAHYPSMLQDLQSGLPLETDSILLAIQVLAQSAQIQTPMFDMVAALLTARARLRK